tara:strand:+ start:2814 stop:3830 length:1017 start_codon:yes stop_codon:yes gene_type:complete
MLTARNLITNAARTAGIIGVAEDLNANESVQALNELNNLIEGLELDANYPSNNVTNQIAVTNSSFTIGRTEVFTNGQTTDTFTSGTITGLSTNISSTTAPTNIVFNNPTVIDSNGVKYKSVGTLTLKNGTVTETGGGDRTDSNSVGTTFNAPTIISGTTLSLTNCSFVVSGTLYKTGDVFANRPNRIISVNQITEGVTRPLLFKPENAWDSSYKTGASSGIPRYYTSRGTFPFMTIEVYPLITSGTFDIVSQSISTVDELNDEVSLPTGYNSVLQFQLAVILAEDYGYTAKAGQLTLRANKALGRVKKINNQGQTLTNTGTPGMGNYYNFNTDSYRGA